jgi:hypothetical protein
MTAVRETTTRDPLVVVSTWRCHTGREAELERLADDLVGPSGVVLHDTGSPDYAE